MQPTPNMNPSWQPHAQNPSVGRRLTIVLSICAGAAGAIVAAIALPGQVQRPATATPVANVSQPEPQRAAAPEPAPQKWLAAAPGRVEPRTGHIRIGTSVPGRVADIAVAIHDRVTEDEVLIRLEDKEARARLTAAEAEVAARQRERDAQPGTQGREDVLGAARKYLRFAET